MFLKSLIKNDLPKSKITCLIIFLQSVHGLERGWGYIVIASYLIGITHVVMAPADMSMV